MLRRSIDSIPSLIAAMASFSSLCLALVVNMLAAVYGLPVERLNPGGAHWPKELFVEMYLQPEDFERALVQPVEEISDAQMQAMQIPSLFEGDIEGIPPIDRLSDDGNVFLYPYNSALNVDTYHDKLWPNSRVPYALEPGLEPEQRAAIAQAFDEYKLKTCVKFVPKEESDFDYIYIKKNRDYGCSSYVGRAGGNQTVSLEVGKCFSKGIIAHELMHSIGFFHEHSRTDRDQNVDILEGNIKPGMLRNFERYPAKIIDGLGLPYDYASVMHYHKLAFSRNGRPTILPKNRAAEIGQRLRLSEIDAAKINKLYKCPSEPEPTSTSPIPTTTETTLLPSTTEAITSTSTSTSSTEQPSVTETTTESTSVVSTTTGTPTSTSTSTSTTTSQEPTSASSTEKPECKNLNAHCDMWAAIGHCEWSEKYMGHYCAKACHICSDLEPEKDKNCHDKNLFCGYWARIGECKSEAKFMKIFCRKSCDLCDEAPGIGPELPFSR